MTEKTIVVHYKHDLGQEDLVVKGHSAGYAIPDASLVARIWAEKSGGTTHIIPLANILSIEFAG
jgi:hypothetical protein